MGMYIFYTKRKTVHKQNGQSQRPLWSFALLLNKILYLLNWKMSNKPGICGLDGSYLSSTTNWLCNLGQNTSPLQVFVSDLKTEASHLSYIYGSFFSNGVYLFPSFWTYKNSEDYMSHFPLVPYYKTCTYENLKCIQNRWVKLHGPSVTPNTYIAL